MSVRVRTVSDWATSTTLDSRSHNVRNAAEPSQKRYKTMSACATKSVRLNNGVEMPIVGLGMWQMNPGKEIRAVVNKALELGYRHFDTAYFYQNEHHLGQVLKEWLDSGRVKREELFIVTKLPLIAMWSYRVNEFLRFSLGSLQLDYVDLYLVQFPIGLRYIDETEMIPRDANGNVKLDPYISLEAVWKGMEREVAVGRTKSIGISNFNQNQVERVLNTGKVTPQVLQVEVNAYCQQKELRQFCKTNNIHVTAYAPLGSTNSLRNHSGEQNNNLNILNESTVQEIAAQHKKTPAQILLRFLAQKNVSVIPKSVTPSRMAENIDIFGFHLNQDEIDQLETLDHGKAGQCKRLYFTELLKGIEDHPEYPWKE